MIEELSEDHALERLSKAAMMPPGLTGLTDQLLAQLFRRAITFMAPCSSSALVRAVGQSFVGTRYSIEVPIDRLEGVLDELIAFGDILEMRTIDDAGWDEHGGMVLVSAPPAYVVCKTGSAVVLGIAGDNITPLTKELEALVEMHGPLRTIPKADGDALAHLSELGLLPLSERAWLRVPKSESAESYVTSWTVDLQREPVSSDIPELQVFDGSRSWKYKDKWGALPKGQSGIYIGRRPRRYGSPRWCIVDVKKGELRRFLDIGAPTDKLRACDVAWRIQAGLDALRASPQEFSVVGGRGSTVEFRFYSPLPSWCERHLSIFGRKVMVSGCLFAFELPQDHASVEANFLSEMLWMKTDSTAILKGGQ